MKRIAIITLLLLSTTLPLRSQLASGADEAYRRGDYDAAIEGYEALISEGLQSPELYYNLGGAYFRDENIGRSILNYERALRLQPGMKDAKQSLAVAYAHTADRIAALPVAFPLSWWHKATRETQPHVWRIIWLLLLALTCTSVVLFRTGKNIGLRKTGFATAITSVILLLAVTATLISCSAFRKAHSEAIVMQAAISLKTEPQESATEFMILHEGTKVAIQESQGLWHRVKLSDGSEGWCLNNDIERI